MKRLPFRHQRLFPIISRKDRILKLWNSFVCSYHTTKIIMTRFLVKGGNRYEGIDSQWHEDSSCG
jgi:hypothetical protein